MPLAGLVLPTAHAYEIGAESVNVLCNFLPCNAAGGGATRLSMYVFERIVLAFQIGIIAVAIISLFISAVKMTAFSSEESTVKEAKTSYVYIITGLAIIGLAKFFVNAFSPGTVAVGEYGEYTGTQGALVNLGIAEMGVSNVVFYFKSIIALSLMVNIVVQAFRLITSQGQEEQTNKAKGRLIGGFIGAGIIMLANVITVSVAPSTSGATGIGIQIAGMANYLLMILGFMSVIAIVVAGIMLVVSFDESMKDKAKNIVKTSVVGLIIVLTSYALVNAFITI